MNEMVWAGWIIVAIKRGILGGIVVFRMTAGKNESDFLPVALAARVEGFVPYWNPIHWVRMWNMAQQRSRGSMARRRQAVIGTKPNTEPASVDLFLELGRRRRRRCIVAAVQERDLFP
jgi:hypothetical protein